MYRRDQLSQRMSRWIFCSPLCDYYTTWSFFSAVASRKLKTELVVCHLVSPWSRTSIRHNYRGPPTSILECDRYHLIHPLHAQDRSEGIQELLELIINFLESDPLYGCDPLAPLVLLSTTTLGQIISAHQYSRFHNPNPLGLRHPYSLTIGIRYAS